MRIIQATFNLSVVVTMMIITLKFIRHDRQSKSSKIQEILGLYTTITNAKDTSLSPGIQQCKTNYYLKTSSYLSHN